MVLALAEEESGWERLDKGLAARLRSLELSREKLVRWESDPSHSRRALTRSNCLLCESGFSRGTEPIGYVIIWIGLFDWITQLEPR